MAQLNQQIQLSDGRMLGCNEYGPSAGAPLFYFHGTPSARIEFNLFGSDALLHKLNIRLFAIDRPGCGLSDFQPDRRIMDWPADIIELADSFHIECFSILGYSGGGPYAAACARAIPARILKAGIVSGTAPFDQPGLADEIAAESRRFMDLSRERPGINRMILRMMGWMTRITPKKVISNALAALPEPDRAIIVLPEMQQGFLAMIRESMRRGPRGPQHDTKLMVSGWDFRPEDIEIPMFLWHGEVDQNAPIAMGKYMAAAIPKSQAQFYSGEGHLSLFKKKTGEILQALSINTNA